MLSLKSLKQNARRKTIDTNKECDKQIEEYQTLVEQLKLRNNSVKEELTESFREKESQYKNIIDNLRSKK